MEKSIYINEIKTHYTINEHGQVFNTKTRKELKGTYNRNDYHTFCLFLGKQRYYKMGHILVAEAFLSEYRTKEKCYVRHRDGNLYNNNINNLEWVSFSDINKNIKAKSKKDTQKKWKYPNAKRKPIPNYPNYIINTYGEIYSLITRRFLTPHYLSGYQHYELSSQNKSKRLRAHRLVYRTFVGEIPRGMVIDHINGIRDDNRLENLRCVTQSENAFNAQANGHKGQHAVAQYDLNDNFIKEYPSFTAAAREFNVSHAAISSAAKRNGTSCGYKWKEIK